MRLTLKFLHEISSIGLIGSLVAYLVLVATADVNAPAEYAAVRHGIDMICRWILLPSLALVLISGLLAIAVTRPYMEARWVWVKTLLGISMFEGTLGAVASHAQHGAELAALAAAGKGNPKLMAEVIRGEWIGVWTIMTISIANVVLAVWRPRLKRRVRYDAPTRPAPGATSNEAPAADAPADTQVDAPSDRNQADDAMVDAQSDPTASRAPER